jgi:hypothetical protein
MFSCLLSQCKRVNEGRQVYMAIPRTINIGSEGFDILKLMAIDVIGMAITGAK